MNARPTRAARKAQGASAPLARAQRAHRARDLATAAALCDAVLAREPANAEALHLRALVDRDQGDLRGAMRRLGQAIALRGDAPDMHLDLANIQLALGRLRDAEEAAASATRLAPDQLPGWYALGNIRYALGELAGAVEAYERAVACDPGHAQASNNLGTVLLQLGDRMRAHDCFRRALEANPRYAIAANNLGTVFEAEGEAETAEAWFEAAASLDPGYVEPRLNRAASLEKRGAWRDALAEITRALDVAPNLARAQWNQSLLHLRLEALAAGWSRFDVGIGVADYRGAARPHTITPLRPDARRILLWGEQGIGEQMLGLSMLRDLDRRGVTGVVETDPRLIPLLARSFPRFVFVPSTLPPDPRTLGGFDAALPMLSLGRHLRPDLAAFPRHDGFLKADPVRVAALRERYAGPGDERIVGLAWCSGARRHAEAKSMELEAWAPILRTPGCRFVSLQYGADAEMLARARAATGVEVVADPAVDQIRDLDGYAAQIAAMDHVVTVSNTTAHMAGALGRPATVLLPHDRGLLWFWFTQRPDCPWYPSLTLLRQQAPGRWDDVIEAAARRLADDRHHP